VTGAKRCGRLLCSNLKLPQSSFYYTSRNSKGFPRAGASNKGGVGKISRFLSLSVNISITVADTAKVTIND